MTELQDFDPGRLEHLAHIRDRAASKARVLLERDRELRDRRQRAVDRIDGLKDSHQGRNRAAAEPLIAAAQAEITTCDHELRELEPPLSEASHEAHAAERLFRAALERAHALGLELTAQQKLEV